jgi:hypothetical protein
LLIEVNGFASEIGNLKGAGQLEENKERLRTKHAELKAQLASTDAAGSEEIKETVTDKLDQIERLIK